MASKGLTQAYDMQDFAYDAAMALREQLKQDGKVCAPDKETCAAIGVLNKAWRDAQEQIRIHRGKPLPGSLTYEKVGGRRKRAVRGSVGIMLDQHGDDDAQPAQPTDVPTPPA